MASSVDISNLALSHLGDRAIVVSIAPPDGTVQAAHCARFYPLARDAVLESHSWRFAMRRASLALLSTTELPSEWAYAYGYPACIKVLAVCPPNDAVTQASGAIFDPQELARLQTTYPFAIESLTDGSQVIYTNAESATVRFIGLVEDTTKFSPLFVMSVARLLASYLAGPILKGKEGRDAARAHLEQYEKIDRPRAQASDAQAGRSNAYRDFVPGSIGARA